METDEWLRAERGVSTSQTVDIQVITHSIAPEAGLMNAGRGDGGDGHVGISALRICRDDWNTCCLNRPPHTQHTPWPSADSPPAVDDEHRLNMTTLID
ncbi:hypothetical protein EYF80_041732 [Liparis tanakae]|uniref:Uncharacterized protein n=1 Tax=Liparis tanakae TaxID=230148 RepID=A0A4Z2G4Q3_9TELE|nr:hypothetical protein EYF80_041732 [Liparis tanakae]